MKYNTFQMKVSIPFSEDGYVFDVGSLYDYLLKLTDTRKARGKRYELAMVIVVVILAKLCGEDWPYGIAQWAHVRRDMLCALLGVPRKRLPSHNTIRRVLGTVIDGQQLQAVLSDYYQYALRVGHQVLVTIDGKTLRGTIPSGQTRGVHLLAAYLPDEGVVLAQLAVENRENEIKVAPRLLKSLDLRGKIVRGDAIHTQRALSAQIVEAGGDYIWIVKDNQPELLEDMRIIFEPEVCIPGFSPAPKDFRTATTLDAGHGRVERRAITVSSALQGFNDWPYLAQAFQLERRVIEVSTGAVRDETVYGITSLQAEGISPERLLEMVRDYWKIENSLHYRRDKTLREDSTRIKNPQLAEVMATLNNLVIGLVTHANWRSLPQARRHFDGCLADALNLVLRRPG